MPGTERDLASTELWEASLARSRRRRELAAHRSPARHAASTVALTAALAASPGTAGAALLRIHSRGPAVVAAQQALGVTPDGEFGPLTRGAVRSFQSAHELEVDGVIGPVTAAALGLTGSGSSSASHGPAPDAATTRAVQAKLGLAVDGDYGPITRGAVLAFQRTHGLEVDGVVGPQTLGALGLGSGTPSLSGGGGSGAGATALAAARREIGVAYVYGGTGSGGFDCSGLTQWAFAQAGVTLPRTSYSQYAVGVAVSAVQAGDLVFWNTDGSGASHVGIATGAGTAISATTHGVREHSITGPYWGAHYIDARRVG